MNATAAQITTIKAQLADGGTLTTSNRGGWNGADLSAAWTDFNFGEPLSQRTAAKIIEFLDRQAMRHTGGRAA